MKISHPETADALAVKAIVNEQTPDWAYAAYYYAMTFLFVPQTSVVAKDNDGQVKGAVVGLYDFEFKKLVISHIASSLEHESNSQMLRTAFQNAALQGVQEVKADLDIPMNPQLKKGIEQEAHDAGLRLSLTFRAQGDKAPEKITAPDNLDAGENRERIVYRHARPDDAHKLWSLVHKINKESGGLDIYALSNYERLCRDLPETCMMATIDDHIIGFATGFMMPGEQRGLFLWQTGVHPSYGGKGIGSKVETELIDSVKPDYLHFTVEASNGAANRTAQKKAEYMNVAYSNPGAITSEHLGGGHEAEVIYYVGNSSPAAHIA